MGNNPQNPNQPKAQGGYQDKSSAGQDNKGGKDSCAVPGQNPSRKDAQETSRKGGMANDPVAGGKTPQREEEDRPRAASK